MKKFTSLLLIIMIACPIISSFLSSCASESDCSMAGRPRLFIYPFKINPETGEISKDTIPWLTVTALSTNYTIINKGEKLELLEIPLSYSADSSSLKLEYKYVRNPEADEKDRVTVTVIDTLTIWHTNSPTFISMDCGYEVKQRIDGYKCTTYLVDSIADFDLNTNTNATKNLEIFHIYR
ncbi:DUF6452 family protein [Bacteroides sp. 224]|uniref:DUF6452 family protein n=1 Tax=Bacteroides sp. 224 TaxID=2302936 RepID=UPI0013D74795|nr:DUF6452 family protein [Bacteroides sp. 224]NDV65910.1 hypothetical protein [Bacteroides sp. 224]